MAKRARSLRRRLRRAYVHYSVELAVTLCERVAAGEMICVILKEAGMPSLSAVSKWMREKPDFAEAMTEARAAGGRPVGTRGGVWTYCEETAQAVFERLCEGESLVGIGKDPTMPSVTTLFFWRHRIPAFDELVRIAKEIQADRVCDKGFELVDQATTETAYLTHVKLTHLRWFAGAAAPRDFKAKPVEAPLPQKPLTVLVRSFGSEEDPVTGKRKVVSYCPNPWTGEVERQDAPGWERPGGPDTILIPA